MKINRLKDVSEYEAPGHFDMKGFRLEVLRPATARILGRIVLLFTWGRTTHTATT